MFYLLIWWILLILIGLAAMPVAFRFFAHLPDRGYAFTKPLGILLVAYPLWLLTSFGLLQNTFGTIALLVILMAALAWGYGFWKRAAESPRAWLREYWQHALAVELVFTIAFFAFAYYRAFNPEIQATEKPMDFMFVNSILRSPQFPPHDAWMSGYAISYYYLGYLMVALLTKLSAVPSAIGFNLGLTMVYALSATAAFGLGYNLVKLASGRETMANAARTTRPVTRNSNRAPRDAAAYFFGVLAALFLLVVGNLEAPFESLHNTGVGSEGFYQWLDINGLAEAQKSGSFIPRDNWWWWRASRVVNDHNPTTGEHIEVIDEFPSFSFLLGDLHPHVLALPFGLIALAAALNILSTRRRPTNGLLDFLGKQLTRDRLFAGLIAAVFWIILQMVVSAVSGTTNAAGGPMNLIRQVFTLKNLLLALIFASVWIAATIGWNLRSANQEEVQGLVETAHEWLTPGMLLLAVLLGGLGMLNTWDIVTYGFIVVAAFAFTEFRAAGRWSGALLVKSALFGIALLFVSYVLYLPFYIGFSSQVRGIAPDVFFRTPLHQYLMMFGLFVFIVASYVVVLLGQRRGVLGSVLKEAGSWALFILAVPVVIAAVGMVVLAASAELREQVAGLLNLTNSGQVMRDVLAAYAGTLISRPGVFLLLVVLIAGIVALGRRQLEAEVHLNGAADLDTDTSMVFALLLAFTGFLLTFGVEFLYVNDIFGTRMNTVFKLYFQAWTLFSIAGAFAVYYIWRSTRGVGRTVWAGAFAVLLLLSLVFPLLAYPNRANDFQANPTVGLPTLDGTLWIKASNPDDYAAIHWMNAHAANDAVILEAYGDSYRFDDRVSAYTGLPTVLGWVGHEDQWRGTVEEQRKRAKDIEQIYKTLDPNQARTLLQQYEVNYVIVGGIEREKFGLTRPMIEKFVKLGSQVFSQGSMQVFQVQ